MEAGICAYIEIPGSIVGGVVENSGVQYFPEAVLHIVLSHQARQVNCVLDE